MVNKVIHVFDIKPWREINKGVGLFVSLDFHSTIAVEAKMTAVE
jgi:hypothetical protein